MYFYYDVKDEEAKNNGPEWISVKNLKRPEDEQEVLITNKTKKGVRSVLKARYSAKDDRFVTSGVAEVIAWMECPAPFDGE